MSRVDWERQCAVKDVRVFRFYKTLFLRAMRGPVLCSGMLPISFEYWVYSAVHVTALLKGGRLLAGT